MLPVYRAGDKHPLARYTVGYTAPIPRCTGGATVVPAVDGVAVCLPSFLTPCPLSWYVSGRTTHG
jgi:hypothetical protein